MKKFLTLLTIGTTTLLSSVGSFAAPPPHHEHEPHPAAKHSMYPPAQTNTYMREEHRMREERGVERLKQHRWQAGYVMPQHYRGNGYKVDYKNSHLPKPDRNQQWYKINNDYILVDSKDNSIVRILSF